MFGKSYLISLVVRYLLAEQMDQLKNWGDEQNKRLEGWVRQQIPGTMWDSKVWGIVKPIIPTCISIALGQLGSPERSLSGEGAVAQIVFDERIQKQLAA